VEEGHLVLVLSERKEQCDLLHAALKEKVGVAIIYGRVGKKARKKIFTEFKKGFVQVLVSTGRLTRPVPDKPGPVFHDCRDHKVPALGGMFGSRLKIYRGLLGDERIPPELRGKSQKQHRAELQYKRVKRRPRSKADRVEDRGQLYLFE